MGGGEGGAGGRNRCSYGGAPWLTARRSPESFVQALSGMIFQSESTGRERETRRVHTGVKRDRTRDQRGGSPRRHAGGLGARGQSTREPQIARETDWERAEMKASSPRRRTWAEVARIDGEARSESRWFQRRFSACVRAGARQGRSE